MNYKSHFQTTFTGTVMYCTGKNVCTLLTHQSFQYPTFSFITTQLK